MQEYIMDNFEKFPQSLYYPEAKFLESLQGYLSDVGEYIVPISSIGDPSKGFIIYFPILLALNYLRGIKFLGAFIVSEWVNMVSICVPRVCLVLNLMFLFVCRMPSGSCRGRGPTGGWRSTAPTSPCCRLHSPVRQV